MIDSKTHTIMVEACDFCGESFHPTYACPYHPRYGNHHDSSYASPQPDFVCLGQVHGVLNKERRTIEDMEKDMISDWLSPSTKKYPFDGWSNSSYQQDTYSSMQNQPSRDIIRFLLETEQDMDLTEQELDQWIEQRDQEAEEEIKSILQKISAETMSPIPLESVEVFDALLLTHRSREPDITAEFDILILVLNLEDKVWDKFGGVSGIVECGMNGFAHDSTASSATPANQKTPRRRHLIANGVGNSKDVTANRARHVDHSRQFLQSTPATSVTPVFQPITCCHVS
ncbi:hypothetical protein Sjap_008999 [Stephania japonica]|uniref:C2H2-type domain-containing protein n=1 Tax=Stephania japonica TaxID=461633 RepID=A0AAP0JSX0_9MAGN